MLFSKNVWLSKAVSTDVVSGPWGASPAQLSLSSFPWDSPHCVQGPGPHVKPPRLSAPAPAMPEWGQSPAPQLQPQGSGLSPSPSPGQGSAQHCKSFWTRMSSPTSIHCNVLSGSPAQSELDCWKPHFCVSTQCVWIHFNGFSQVMVDCGVFCF